MIALTTNKSFVNKYSTPFSVDTTTDTSESKACLNGCYYMLSNSKMNWFFVDVLSKKTSFRIIS